MANRQSVAATAIPTPVQDGTPAFTSVAASAATSVANATTNSTWVDPDRPSPEEQAAIRKLAEWVALGVLGVYVLLALVILVNWSILRLRRKPEAPAPSSLPPEATEHGKGAFLVPTPSGAHDPYRGGAAPGSRPGSARARASSHSSAAPRRPNRPDGLQLQSRDSFSSVRSGFYRNGQAAGSSPSLNNGNPFGAGATMHSPSPLGEGEQQRNFRASRASSIASARYYHANGGHDVSTAPQMPPIAHMQMQNGRW